MPLLAGSRRIARVVMLSAAAGIALADGDIDAALELGTEADSDASDLGIEREIPLIRCILARAELARGDVPAAAASALGAIEAARSLTFRFPLALCLETAALVCARQPAGGVRRAGVISDLLIAARAIRDRGDRPGPVTLAVAVEQARAVAADAGTSGRPPSESGPVPDADAAAALAVAALSGDGQVVIPCPGPG
jgi:hypothetical protein